MDSKDWTYHEDRAFSLDLTEAIAAGLYRFNHRATVIFDFPVAEEYANTHRLDVVTPALTMPQSAPLPWVERPPVGAPIVAAVPVGLVRKHAILRRLTKCRTWVAAGAQLILGGGRGGFALGGSNHE